MLALGYVIIALIVIGWYKLILSIEISQYQILSRSIKLLINNRKVIFDNILFIGEEDEKQREKFDYIKNKLFDMFIMIINVGGFLLLCPIIIRYILEGTVDGLGKYTIFTFMICGLVVMRLKEVSQQCINLINEYIKGILVPIEHNPQLIQKDELKRVEMEWTLKKVIEFLVYICLGIIIILGGHFIYLKYKDREIVGVISTVALFIIAVFGRRKSKANVNQKENKIEIDKNTLGGIEKDIENMCEKLGISNIEIIVSEDGNIKIETTIKKDGTPHIEVSYQFVQILCSESGAKDILLYTIGHELAHIYYHDFKNIRRRIKISYFAYFISLLLIVLLMLSIDMHLIQYLVLTLLIFHNLTFKIICDKRYWYQIAELRADRLAMQIYDGEKMLFINFWKRYDEESRCKAKGKNTLYNYYRKYIKIEAHPSMIRRMELIEKRERWYNWEYIEHMLLIWKWRVTNKGWNGYSSSHIKQK